MSPEDSRQQPAFEAAPPQGSGIDGFRETVPRRIAVRVLPFLFLLYVIAFLDRMNVGAAALEMPRDLGFSDQVLGLGAGVFFLGYFLLQIPGALAAEHWSARRWISAVMFVWGILTVLMAFVQTEREFYAVRFLVGAAEAGFFPAVVVYLTHWFLAADRAKAVAGFYAAMPLSYVIGSPLAGLLLRLSWLGWKGWRWLFIIEGVPAVVMSLVTLFYLTDWPLQAKWLALGEREWMAGQLEREKRAKRELHAYKISEALRDRNVLLLTLCYFFALTGSYGIAFWLPSMLKRLSGRSDLEVTLLASLPYVAGFLTQQINAWHSDRNQERRWHATLPVLLSGVSIFLAIKFGSSVLLSVIFFTMTCGAYYAYLPPFWAVPTEFLGDSAAAASIGLINSVGNLGGFVGPLIMGHLASRTGSFNGGLWYLVGSFALSGMFMLAVRAGPRRPRATEFERTNKRISEFRVQE